MVALVETRNVSARYSLPRTYFNRPRDRRRRPVSLGYSGLRTCSRLEESWRPVVVHRRTTNKIFPRTFPVYASTRNPSPMFVRLLVPSSLHRSSDLSFHRGSWESRNVYMVSQCALPAFVAYLIRADSSIAFPRKVRWPWRHGRWQRCHVPRICVRAFARERLSSETEGRAASVGQYRATNPLSPVLFEITPFVLYSLKL